jgi:hypothetical protein
MTYHIKSPLSSWEWLLMTIGFLNILYGFYVVVLPSSTPVWARGLGCLVLGGLIAITIQIQTKGNEWKRLL